MKHRRPAISPPRRQIASASGRRVEKQGGALPQPEFIELVALFNAGRYVELEQRAGSLVARYPDSGLVWKLYAASLQVQAKQGLLAMQKAAELLPGDAEVHSNLGVALKKLGRLDEAVASYRRALAIEPNSAKAHSNLGNALMQSGRLDEAVASYRRALAIEPNYAKAHGNLGNALMESGLRDEAVASYRRALAIEPNFAEAHFSLGIALTRSGSRDEAAASFRRAVEINPNHAEAHNNLGVALLESGQLDEAVASYRRAVGIKADYAEAHNNLGIALINSRRFDEAVASYRRVVEINPNYAEAHGNLGIALMESGQVDEAVASYRRAVGINPNYAEAHNNLGIALQESGRLDDAMASYRRALEVSPEYADAHSNLLFLHSFRSDQPAELLMSDARGYGHLVARRAATCRAWENSPVGERCLRVGLVSGDFQSHPVGYFVEGIVGALASHFSDRIELFAYPSHYRTDALTERIKGCCRGWYSAVGLSDEHLARRIREDRIDILIDLSGHTAHNRLPMFAWKPAPVQVSWLGYFATTGVAEIDYFIADPWTLPKSEEAYFTEKVWRLPETRLCFAPPEVEVAVSELPALNNGYVTFGCFNNLTKMNDAVVALWSQILLLVPESRLLLKSWRLSQTSVQQSVISRFAAHGIGGHRLVLEGASPRAQYLAAYNRVDIALDPFPFTGGATSAEALWMGVPVLTLAGDRLVSRQGVGLLANAGLPDWISVDADDYVRRAVLHVGDLRHLAVLRRELRQKVLTSPLFDSTRFARHFEAALRGMWTQWCNVQ